MTPRERESERVSEGSGPANRLVPSFPSLTIAVARRELEFHFLPEVPRFCEPEQLTNNCSAGISKDSASRAVDSWTSRTNESTRTIVILSGSPFASSTQCSFKPKIDERREEKRVRKKETWELVFGIECNCCWPKRRECGQQDREREREWEYERGKRERERELEKKPSSRCVMMSLLGATLAKGWWPTNTTNVVRNRTALVQVWEWETE